MGVAGGEKFSSTRGDPPIPSNVLTRRAVATRAAIIRDGGTMPTAGALIEMAAECGGTTARNGQQHFDVFPTDPLAAAFDKCLSRGADQIGHLKRRPAHLPLPQRLVF